MPAQAAICARDARSPASVSTATPASGAKRQIQAERLEPHQFRSAVSESTSRSALRRAMATTRPRPTTTSEAATRHDDEREHLPGVVAPVARERDQRQVARVQHDLDRQQQDQRAAAGEHAVEADPEQDRRDRRGTRRRRRASAVRPPCVGRAAGADDVEPRLGVHRPAAWRLGAGSGRSAPRTRRRLADSRGAGPPRGRARRRRRPRPAAAPRWPRSASR